jgi:hypothetical protein
VRDFRYLNIVEEGTKELPVRDGCPAIEVKNGLDRARTGSRMQWVLVEEVVEA